MTQKRREKWVPNHINVCIYNKKQNLIGKRTLWCPASQQVLSNKNKLDILSEPGPRNLGHDQKMINWEKTKSVFWLFIKQLVFRIEFDENIEKFLKKTGYQENFFIGFGRAKTDYVSMDLSQFRKDENWLFSRGKALNFRLRLACYLNFFF
jgi:hypothetical protein